MTQRFAECGHMADTPGAYVCDLTRRHGGRHKMRGIATWNRDGYDVRRWNPDTRTYDQRHDTETAP